MRTVALVLAGIGLASSEGGSASFAAAQEPSSFAVEGRVANGTAGARTPDALPMSVFAFTNDRLVGSWETEAGADGAFRFDAIASHSGATYAVGAEYQGAAYSARLSPLPGATSMTQDLTVYEATPADPGIRFEQSAVLVSQQSSGAGAITVTEIHAIVNPTDRAFVPRADGPGGPAGLLVFGLPPNAFDLNPGLGLDPGRLVQIGRGFASLVPIVPGRREVSFTYRLGYAESNLLLERTVRYPTDRFRVVVPEGGPAMESDQLRDREIVTLGEQRHQVLSGGPFGPGTVLGVTVSGLAVPGGPLARVPPGVPAALGAAAGLFAIGVYWARTRRSSGPASVDSVAERILALDLEHAEGRISEEEHRRRREALLQRARGLVRP